MAQLRVIISLPNQNGSSIDRTMPTTTQDVRRSIRSISDFIRGIAGGARNGRVVSSVDVVNAAALLTITSTGPANGQQIEICGTTFTAATTPSGANDFQRSDTPATVAASIAALINTTDAVNRPRVNDSISASSTAGGVVVLSAKIAGKIGNGLNVRAVGTFANTAITNFASGSDGTTRIFDVT